MKVMVAEDGGIMLTEVYSGVYVRTSDQGDFGICERDGGILVMKDGQVVYDSTFGQDIAMASQRECIACGMSLVATVDDRGSLDGHWCCRNDKCERRWLVTSAFYAGAMVLAKDKVAEESPGLLSTKVLELHSIAVVEDPPNPHATFDLEDAPTNRAGEGPAYPKCMVCDQPGPFTCECGYRSCAEHGQHKCGV